MGKYRIVGEVDAIKADSIDVVINFLMSIDNTGTFKVTEENKKHHPTHICVRTTSEDLIVYYGDYLIVGLSGILFTKDEKFFKENYEKAEV